MRSQANQTHLGNAAVADNSGDMEGRLPADVGPVDEEGKARVVRGEHAHERGAGLGGQELGGVGVWLVCVHAGEQAEDRVVLRVLGY